MRFNAGIIALFIFLASCGPKPEFRISTDGTSNAIWEAFLNRIPDNDSIAIKGKIKLKSSKTYEFGFEAYYINTDTLNFTAHAPLGAGWVKVLLLGDSVYVTDSKEKTTIIYDKNDQIVLGDTDNRLSISAILNALFFTSPPPEPELTGHEKTLYNYKYALQKNIIKMYIDTDNCFPVSQITQTEGGTYQTKYFDWKMVNKNQFYPTKIIMESSSSSGSMQFQIKYIKTGVKLPRDLFFHNFKG